MYWHMISHIGQVLYTGIRSVLKIILTVFMYWHKSSQFGSFSVFAKIVILAKFLFFLRNCDSADSYKAKI